MQIRRKYIVQRLYGDFDDHAPFSFDLDGPHDLQVEFRPSDEDEEGSVDDAVVEATSRWTANDHVRAAFETMDEGGIPEGSTGSREEWESKYLDEDGKVPRRTVYPFKHLSEPVQDFSRGVRDELDGAVNRCVEILRWRHGLSLPHDPVSGQSFGPSWSLDGEKWRRLPVSLKMEFTALQPVSLDDENLQAVEKVLAGEKSEPLAHQLLREAQDVESSHPRSALVIGLAALENGVKDFLVRVDRSEGLRRVLEELPAPSVWRMLTEILPGLPVPVEAEEEDRTFPELPRDLTDTVRSASSARNEVVHVWTSETVSGGLVRRSLKAIRDLLYLMDYYSGEKWALQHVRDETLEEMGLR